MHTLHVPEGIAEIVLALKGVVELDASSSSQTIAVYNSLVSVLAPLAEAAICCCPTDPLEAIQEQEEEQEEDNHKDTLRIGKRVRHARGEE